MIDPRAFLGIALDPLRLAILGRAAEGAFDVDEVAQNMARRPREVREAVGKLRAAGLVTEDLRLDDGVLRDLAASLPQMPPPGPSVAAPGMWTAEEAEVLCRFFSADRLIEIPSQLHKRRVVLERLAQEFEPGVRYQEAEVNFTLQLWHADYAALRRYLVDEGFMTRAEGVYWRTGGRYPEEPAPGSE